MKKALKVNVYNINKTLAKQYGVEQVVMRRSPSGYYYFTGDHKNAMRIASLYYFNLDGVTIADVMAHVAEELAQY